MADHDLPPLDPAVGSEANEDASQARRSALAMVSAGDLTLEELFEAVEREREEEHRHLGHLHLRATLIALPGVGEVRADAILEAADLEGDRHLATLGTHQRDELVRATGSG